MAKVKKIKQSSQTDKVCAAVLYCSLLLYWIGTISWDVCGWHDQQRIAELSLLVVLFFLSLALYRDFFSAFRYPLLSLVFFVGFALCGLASAVNASLLHWAFLEWALLLSLCLGTVVLARLRQINGELFDHAMLVVIVGVCTFYLFGFFSRYTTLFIGLPMSLWNMFTGFANVRFFGQFQTMTLPLLAVIVITASSRLWKWGGFFLLSSWWMLSIASGTRGTWLAMATAMIAIWSIGRSTGKRWVLWQIMGIVIGLVLYGLMFSAVRALLNIELQLINRLPSLAALSLRDVIWVDAWRIIYTHPWLGVGPMHFAFTPNGIGAHPHNSVLQIAAEWGVPALLMMSALVVMVFHRFMKHLRAQSNETSFENVLCIALFASLVAAGVQSLVDGVIVMPYSQVTLMVLVGWAIGICSSSAKLERQAAPVPLVRWKKIAFFGISALLLGMVIVLALQDVPHLQERMQRYTDKYHTTYFNPRFWQQGWINE